MILPRVNHYLRNDRKEIMNSLPDKFIIPVYEIYLHVTPPPSGCYHL